MKSLGIALYIAFGVMLAVVIETPFTSWKYWVMWALFCAVDINSAFVEMNKKEARK